MRGPAYGIEDILDLFVFKFLPDIPSNTNEPGAEKQNGDGFWNRSKDVIIIEREHGIHHRQGIDSTSALIIRKREI